MTLQALYYVPGVSKVNSDYAGWGQFGFVNGRYAKGRFKDMMNCRFVAGFPEKIGGFASAAPVTITGVPRTMRDWRDNTQIRRIGIGTNLKLFYYSLQTLADITPWRAIVTGTLTNAITTSMGSAIVSVASPAHGLVTGDYVILTASASVGGIGVGGVYPITVTDSNDYTVVTNTVATSGATGGGSIAFTYYRITLTNPFVTTLGSNIVTVNQTGHGAGTGDYVTINGASAVGGLTLSGEYQIQSTSANAYTILASSNATSGATGGGTPNLQYDISIGYQDSGIEFGYGTGGYGTNGYGTEGSTGVFLAARVWSLAAYGQQLLCSPSGGTIYVWDPTIGGRAYPLYNAPPAVLAMFVTPERYVIALGVNADGMTLAWPDQVDYTQWTATPLNTANQRDLQGGDYFVGGLPVQFGVSLISSNSTVFLMTYTGDTEIYDTVPTATQAGFIGPNAAVVLGGIAYWMSQHGFWQWSGSTSPLPSDEIRDYVFNNLNYQQAAKFFARTIASKKEVWFFYCSAASVEIDSYVIFHTDQQCWSIGPAGTQLKRTAAIDLGLYYFPMSSDTTGTIYNDENGTDANGAALDAYVTFAPLELNSGNQWVEYFAFEPDFERQSGNISLSILSRIYPNDADVVDGPYTIAPANATPRIDLRGSAKMIGFKMESKAVGGDFRLGLPRVEVQPGAARR